MQHPCLFQERAELLRHRLRAVQRLRPREVDRLGPAPRAAGERRVRRQRALRVRVVRGCLGRVCSPASRAYSRLRLRPGHEGDAAKLDLCRPHVGHLLHRRPSPVRRSRPAEIAGRRLPGVGGGACERGAGVGVDGWPGPDSRGGIGRRSFPRHDPAPRRRRGRLRREPLIQDDAHRSGPDARSRADSRAWDHRDASQSDDQGPWGECRPLPESRCLVQAPRPGGGPWSTLRSRYPA